MKNKVAWRVVSVQRYNNLIFNISIKIVLICEKKFNMSDDAEFRRQIQLKFIDLDRDHKYELLLLRKRKIEKNIWLPFLLSTLCYFSILWSGLISKAELRQFIEGPRAIPLGEQELKDAFAYFDTNDDGKSLYRWLKASYSINQSYQDFLLFQYQWMNS